MFKPTPSETEREFVIDTPEQQTVPGTEGVEASSGFEEPARIVMVAKSTVEDELKEVEQLFAAGNVGGLIKMLSTGQMQTKIAAANYLAEIGDSNAIAALEETSEQWEGEADRAEVVSPERAKEAVLQHNPGEWDALFDEPIPNLTG